MYFLGTEKEGDGKNIQADEKNTYTHSNIVCSNKHQRTRAHIRKKLVKTDARKCHPCLDPQQRA